MSRIMKRSAAFAATAVAAVSISLAGAGTAGAAPSVWHSKGISCQTGYSDQQKFDLGLLHASEGTRGCTALQIGGGYKGHGVPNSVVLGTLPLPNGTVGVAWIDDPTGMYPTR